MLAHVRRLGVVMALTVLPLLTATLPAHADIGNDDGTVDWYASRVSVSAKTVKHKVCFAGVAEDLAGYDQDFDIPGTIWENSIGRKVTLERKKHGHWTKVKATYTDDSQEGRNFRICVRKKSGTYRVWATKNYYPYNTETVRVYGAGSPTVVERF